MNGISITAWVIFWANIVATLSVAATSRFQSRPKAEPTHWAGIRVGATMKSSEAWRAAHPAAFRWSRLDVIGVCGAALICLLLLPARWLAWRSALRLLHRLARTQHMARRQGGRESPFVGL